MTSRFLLPSVLWLALCPLALTAPMPPISSNVITTNTSSLIYITLEEHFDSQSVLPYELEDDVAQLFSQLLGPSDLSSLNGLLQNISLRVPDMNENGIRMQVVSNDPEPYVLSKPEVAAKANNELAAAISTYPDRFRGFCFLPMAYPTIAAQELKRCSEQLGFVGALVDSHLLNNTFYDGPAYDVLWSMLEELDIPIYLHPTYPPISQVNGSEGLYTPDSDVYSLPAAADLGTAAWGWHSDCGLQFVRLWLGGVFDRHPNLKIVLGHMGEMLPYMLARVDYYLGLVKTNGVTIVEAYDTNVWVTTSGFFSLDPFRTLMAVTASDRIMYSVDYPWATNEEGGEFMTALKASGLVNESQWQAIAFENAQKLLRI